MEREPARKLHPAVVVVLVLVGILAALGILVVGAAMLQAFLSGR